MLLGESSLSGSYDMSCSLTMRSTECCLILEIDLYNLTTIDNGYTYSSFDQVIYVTLESIVPFHFFIQIFLICNQLCSILLLIQSVSLLLIVLQSLFIQPLRRSPTSCKIYFCNSILLLRLYSIHSFI